MDENYILLPHGVNFQEAIFPDTQENRRMFASLFQFSNCSQAQHVLSFSSDWEIQEDNRVRDLSALRCLFSKWAQAFTCHLQTHIYLNAEQQIFLVLWWYHWQSDTVTGRS